MSLLWLKVRSVPQIEGKHKEENKQKNHLLYYICNYKIKKAGSAHIWVHRAVSSKLNAHPTASKLLCRAPAYKRLGFGMCMILLFIYQGNNQKDVMLVLLLFFFNVKVISSKVYLSSVYFVSVKEYTDECHTVIPNGVYRVKRLRSGQTL